MIEEFKRYCKENIIICILFGVIIALFYAKQAFSTDFYVDAEVILNNPNTIYNWGDIGRFGLILVKLIMGGNWYNPYFNAVLFVLTFWITGITTVYLFNILIPTMNKYINMIFLCLYLVFPTFAEQFMFRFQAFEVALAMLFVVISTRCIIEYLKNKSYLYLIIAVILDIISFGIYQSMVNLQICYIVSVYLVMIDNNNSDRRKQFLKWAIIQFMTSLLIYEIIAKLFFDNGNYLTGQVGWLSGNMPVTVRNLLAYIKHILLGQDAFYPVTYLVCVLCSVLLFIWNVTKRREMLIQYILGFGGLLVSPFLLALVTGTPTAYRAQSMLAFVGAFLISYFLVILKSKLEENQKWIYSISVCIAVVLILTQSSALARLFYSQDIIRNADKMIANQIMTRIDEADDNKKPVIFIGHLDAKTNGSCYTKDKAQSFLCYSSYEFAFVEGVPVADADYYNTCRILGYFKTLGFEYTIPGKEMVDRVLQMDRVNSIWPATGSVVELEDCIIIRLS